MQYFSFTVSCSRVRGFLKTEMFFPTSTLSVFEKFPPVHTKMLKQWEYDSRTGAVWRMAPSYSKTSVFVRPHEEIKVAFWRDVHYPLSCPLAPQSQFLRGLLIFSVIRSSWKHFCFFIHIFSTVWIGTLRLLVAPTADTHKILSQTHHIFMEVWLISYYFRLFFH